MDETQRQRFADAVERKKAEAQEASEATSHQGGADELEAEQPEDAGSPRQKNSRHRQVTADKWNQ